MFNKLKYKTLFGTAFLIVTNLVPEIFKQKPFITLDKEFSPKNNNSYIEN